MDITFYQYNSYFLRVPEDLDAIPTAHPLEPLQRLIRTSKTIPSSALVDLGIPCPTGETFVGLEHGDLLIFGSASAHCTQTFLTGSRINEDRLKYAGSSRYNAWKAHLDGQMIDILLERPQSPHDPLAVCQRYTHSDAHSLWIYNPYTEVFTCAASSHKYTKTFLTKKDTNTLYAFMLSQSSTESRIPTHVLCPNTDLAKCKTLNRVRILLDDKGTLAVLNLYSLHPDYRIPPKIIDRVKELVRSTYTESRLELHKNYEKLEQLFTTDYHPGGLTDFLRTLTEQISERLYFEACSIFTRTKEGTLKLVATTDAKLKHATVANVIYNLDDSSLTGLVAEAGRLQVSYDLAQDVRNSKIYNEATLLPGTNWIGVPIKIDSRVIGVVRVKNKYSPRTRERELRNIRPADIEYLQSIATMLSSLNRIEELYLFSQKELKDAQAQLVAQNDFNAVFLHEIKTPISTFALAPLTIKKRTDFVRNVILSGPKGRFASPELEVLVRDSLEKIDLRLTDISVMADRLKFITDTYFFDLIISKNEPQRLGLL